MAEVQSPQQASVCEPTSVSLPWWELLASLKQGGSACTGGELLPLLEKAKAAVATDTQWNTSGVPELLNRASEMARRGSLESARQYAINLLDFQLAAQKYRKEAAKARSVVTGGSSGEGSGQKKHEDALTTSSSSTSSDDTSHVEGSAGHAAGAPMGLECLATISSHNSDPDPITPSSTSTGPSLAQESDRADFAFMVPEPPSKRRRIVPTDRSAAEAARLHEGRLHVPTPQLPQAVSSCEPRMAAGMQEWTGVLGLVAEDGGRASDLCHASLQLPKHMARDMPRALHFTHLVQRRGVMLGNYQVVRTSIKKANMRQMSRLRSMAQHELVAVAALECLHVIVVPYSDSCGELKLVSFVLSS